MIARITVLVLIATLGVITGPSFSIVGLETVSTARAEEAWKVEMDAVCANTQDAMSFSVEQLKALLERCERLKPLIDALEESPRKVYGRRLQMCQNLYSFVLESKKEKEAAK